MVMAATSRPTTASRGIREALRADKAGLPSHEDQKDRSSSTCAGRRRRRHGVELDGPSRPGTRRTAALTSRSARRRRHPRAGTGPTMARRPRPATEHAPRPATEHMPSLRPPRRPSRPLRRPPRRSPACRPSSSAWRGARAATTRPPHRLACSGSCRRRGRPSATPARPARHRWPSRRQRSTACARSTAHRRGPRMTAADVRGALRRQNG